MAKFYDITEYTPAGTLVGDEIFIVRQEGISKTSTFDHVKTGVILPLLNGLSVGDLLDVTLESEVENQLLVYTGSVWENTLEYILSITDIGDVTTTNPVVGQSLVFDTVNWIDDNNMSIGGYTETEHDLGSVSGDVPIYISQGNVQRLTMSGDVNIQLPDTSPTDLNWVLILKIVHNGINAPVFSMNGGEIRIPDGTDISYYGDDGMMYIYRFTSDCAVSEVYGSIVWGEY